MVKVHYQNVYHRILEAKYSYWKSPLCSPKPRYVVKTRGNHDCRKDLELSHTQPCLLSDLIFATSPYLPQYSRTGCWRLMVSLLPERQAELSGEWRWQWRGVCSARRMTSRKACLWMTCLPNPEAHLLIRTQPGETFNIGYLACIAKSETGTEKKSSLYFLLSFSSLSLCLPPSLPPFLSFSLSSFKHVL